MKQDINCIINHVRDKLLRFIICEFKNFVASDKTNLLLDLYNTYQEDERNGVDYLFCLSKTDDVICCLKGGLALTELSDLVIENEDPQKTTLFYFGENHTQNIHLLTIKEFEAQLHGYVEEMAEAIVTYPWVEAYKYFYTKFVSNELIG